MKITLDVARKWGWSLLGAVFLIGAVAENMPGVRLPIQGLRLWNDWNMFAKPGAPLLAFVVGKPRGGGEDVVIVNPVQRTGGFLERLRDAREDKLHESIGKPHASSAVRQGYLAHLCSRYGGSYARLEMRVKARDEAVGLLVAERACN